MVTDLMDKSKNIEKREGYDSTYFEEELSKWHNISFETISSLLQEYAKDIDKENAEILDIGCGSGQYLEELKKIGKIVVGLDTSVAGLQKAKEKNRNLICGSGYPIPIKSSTFDLVFCTEVIEHVPEPQELISEIERVLKPNGKLILTTTTYYFVVTHFKPKKIGKILYFFLGLFSMKFQDKFMKEGIENPWKHLHGFIRKDLLKLFRNESFQVLDWKYFNVQPIVNPNHVSVRYTPIRYLASAINNSFYGKISKIYGPNIILCGRKLIS